MVLRLVKPVLMKIEVSKGTSMSLPPLALHQFEGWQGELANLWFLFDESRSSSVSHDPRLGVALLTLVGALHTAAGRRMKRAAEFLNFPRCDQRQTWKEWGFIGSDHISKILGTSHRIFWTFDRFTNLYAMKSHPMRWLQTTISQQTLGRKSSWQWQIIAMM